MTSTTATRYEPADPGDVRFEIIEQDDEEFSVLVFRINDRGEVEARDSFLSLAEAYSMVGAFRECQETTFEERFAPFGPEWQRDQEGR